MLYWMFSWSANPVGHDNPRTAVPGGSFLDSSGFAADESKVTDFLASSSYKLFNRFQTKMRYFLDSATGAPVINAGTGRPTFNGSPVPLHGPAETYVGRTIDPCHTGVPLIPTQIGPMNGIRTAIAADRLSSINDGSPDNVAVAAFNTLSGQNVEPQTPVFWEDIGSRITFSTGLGPSASLVFQPYPTYDVFVNGRYTTSNFQAPDPMGQFFTNPYPFGTVPCNTPFVVPGGRCGNAGLPADPTARQPEFIRW